MESWKHLNFVDTATSVSPTIYSFHAVNVAVLNLKHSLSPPNTKIGTYVLLFSYVFVYKILTFSLSILKENFDLVEVACTEKSLLVVNTDSAFSMSTFSSSTYFLGVLEARSSHGKPSL